jgi:FixJ family two-component response regulator
MARIEPAFVAVVDDDAAVLDSFRFMLELAGCDVATFAAATDYLATFPARPHCLILDQHMPVMTGLELAARLRVAGLAIPVLLITGAASDEIIGRAAALGVWRVLTKPPTEADLLGFVRACSP